MTLTEIIAWGVLGLMFIASVLEVVDYWLYGKVSDAIKEWWNK